MMLPVSMESPPFTLESDGSLRAAVDLRLYGQSALLKAAHRFTDRCHLHLQTRDEHAVLVHFRVKEGRKEPLAELAGDFFNELLDQRLRALVQQESEGVRNLILAHALSRTSLLDGPTPGNERAEAATAAVASVPPASEAVSPELPPALSPT